MSKNPNKWDGIIGAILKDKNGSYEGLIDVLFSYLDRKSDFFENWDANCDIVNKKSLEYFGKHNQNRQEYQERLKTRQAAAASRQREKAEKEGLKEELVEIKRKIEEKKRENEEKEKEAREKKKQEKAAADKDKMDEEKTEEKKDKEAKDEDSEEEDKKDKGEIPYKCGGVTEKYIWNQSLIELQITIPLPNNVKADDLNVVIEEKKCHVSIKGQESTPILDGEWCERINPTDCLWTVESYEGTGKTLNIDIKKFPEFQGWWECVVKGEPRIDIGKVQPEENNMRDLDVDVQVEIQKAMFDMRQKQLGLPTIEEQKNQAKLEEMFKANPGLRSQFGGKNVQFSK